MIFLGIDPGTAITGYGFIREEGSSLRAVAYGVITTPPDLALPQRLVLLHRALGDLIRLHRPASAAVEQIFFSRNARTALAVGHARGVVLLALAQAGLPVAEYTPLEVKQAITGYGRADKKQIQEMVRVLIGLPEVPRPDDAADALAIAICHLHSSRIRDLAGGAP
ncbi:MAG TPA: crossover junction endodeoxyribonuclease RuvC [Anaerolineae bacterium]|nr:crossover junction endodeoxyribonuclease RuvC [Anaerolineae bacterium]